MTRRKRTTTVKRNPYRQRRRTRSNPDSRINPGGGISGIVMGGFWIGAGMWLGGMIQGFIPSFGGGMVMDLAKGVASAYVVGMIAGRFTHNAGLMAAGAFAPTAWGVVSNLLGGMTGGLSSLTSSIGGSKQPTHAAAPAAPPAAALPPGGAQAGPSNVTQFPQAG
jgi:type IV secretory pathway TrbL component